MFQFTVRVVLHEAEAEDYENLHSLMEEQGFSRTIASDRGRTYHLPEAEYTCEGDRTKAEILLMAKAAATQTEKKYAVLVTQSDGRTWYGLEEVE